MHIKDGKIHEVIPLSEKARLEKLGDLKVIDYGNLVISPGGIDTHVHFNEPGLDQREGQRENGIRGLRLSDEI